jgi:integrase
MGGHALQAIDGMERAVACHPKQRDNIFKRIVREAGDVGIGHIEKDDIIAGRERRAATPAAARNYIESLRGLFGWAYETGSSVTTPAKASSLAALSRRFPDLDRGRGSPVSGSLAGRDKAAVAFDLLLYTGLRRGDAARLGRPHVRDGVARIQTEKTGTWVAIRLEPELLATLAAGPCGELTFICGEGGRPLTKESFGNYFREWCREAGLSKSAHGLRKMAATRAAERGYSNFEMDATFGWQGGGMADLYTRKINREKLSLNAAERVRRIK